MENGSDDGTDGNKKKVLKIETIADLKKVAVYGAHIEDGYENIYVWQKKFWKDGNWKKWFWQ